MTMHPIVVRSIGISMLGLAVGLMAFGAFFAFRYGNPLAIFATAIGVGAGGYGLTVVARRDEEQRQTDRPNVG